MVVHRKYMSKGPIKVIEKTGETYCKCCDAKVDERIFSVEFTARKHIQFTPLCESHLISLVEMANDVMAKKEGNCYE